MIFAKMTPNHAGISIYGDHMDFEHLYDALHDVVGEEGEFAAYETSRLRVLGLCYDLRHAMQGDREVEFVDNGMTPDIMKGLSIIAPEKNVYLKVNQLWPEMLYVTIALGQFTQLYAKKKTKKSYPGTADPKMAFDPVIAQVRLLQSTVTACLKEHISEASYTRVINLLSREHLSYYGYATQYVDMLNERFLAYDPEKRLKNLPTMVKRLSEYEGEYADVLSQVMAAAREHNCHFSQIRYNDNFPDEIDW